MVVLAGIAAYAWFRPQTSSVETIEDTLVNLAKREGSLVIYGAIDATDWENVLKPDFMAIYPWASVEYVQLTPAAIATRAISEYQAGHVGGDVTIMILGPTITIVQAGAGEKYDNPMIKLMNYPNGTYDPEGYWQPGYGLHESLVYNTNYVNAQDLPEYWTDIDDPKWDGNFAADRPSSLNIFGGLLATLYPMMSNATWTSFVEGIAANHPIWAESVSAAFQKVATGEALIGLGSNNDYKTAKEQGAPIERKLLKQPDGKVLVTSQYLPSLILKNCTHPNMAKLFVQWWISASGQVGISKTGRVPAQPEIAAATILSIAPYPSGVTAVPLAYNNPDYWKNPTSWSDLYRELIG
jgi:ABC-type Fe3+ transport system substrate-binding protein